MSHPHVARGRAALLLAATIGFALTGQAVASAATTTFGAVADARVEQAYPSTNYGTLRLAGCSSPTIRSYVKFNVSGLSGTVTSAKLRIHPNSASTSGFEVRGAGSSWTETGLTWSNAPAVGATAVATTGAYACCAGYVTVDVTPLVAANGAVTVVVTGRGGTTDLYRTREWGTAYEPKLDVTTSTGTTTPPPPPPPPPPAPDTTTRYVSTSGSDSNAGSVSAPWRTVGKAAVAAPAGSTVLIAGGSYGEDVVFGVSGVSGAPTTFRAVAGASVSVRSLSFNASHVAVEGLSVGGASGNCVTVSPARSGIVLRRNVIRGCGRNGVGFTRPSTQAYASNVSIVGNTISSVGTSVSSANVLTIYGNSILVEGNDLSGSRNDAVDLWGDRHTYRANRIHDISNSLGLHNDAFQTWTGLGDGAEGRPVTNLVIERNRVERITGSNAHCVMAEGPGHQGWTIRDNVFASIGNQCMILGKKGNGTQGIQGLRIGGNTFVAAGSVNTIEFNLSSSGVLAGNVFFNCRGWSGHPPYYVASTASVTRDYNLAGGTSPRVSEAHGVNADPRFVNAAGGDYRLAAGSPAIDRGDNGALISPVRSVDVAGVATFGAVDIGAHEYR